MTRALDTLARLRRLEAEQAKRDLAEKMAAETASRRALIQAQFSVAQEARVAATALPGAFAAWLPGAAAKVAQAHAAQTEATKTRESARLTLAQARASLKATETLLEAREAEKRLQILRRAELTRGDLWKPGRS